MDKLIDKLPPPALNRPPTQQRSPDPGRFRSIDMQPENAQQDPSYQRMVQDIEALQHRQGWLAGRGAFDKEDFLYLKDREEQLRMTEQGQRDMEATAYAAACARLEREQKTAARTTLRQQQPVKQPHSKSGQTRDAAQVLKVKAHHSREQQQQQRLAGKSVPPELLEQLQARDHKRPRPEDVPAAAAAAVGAAAIHAAGAAPAAANKPITAAGASGMAAQHASTAACSRATSSTQQLGSGQLQQEGPHSKSEERAGLEDLLVYSSESDDEVDDEGIVQPGTCQAAVGPHQRLKLPSAAELLEQDMPSSFVRDPTGTAADLEDAPVPVVGLGAAYPHHAGWI